MPALLVIFVLIHALGLALDWRGPEAFLRADRAMERWDAIQSLQDASWQQISNFIGAHGIIGDYAFHVLLYSAVGRMGVIVIQVLLMLLAAVGVFRLARLSGLTSTVSTIAAAIFLALPHMLVFPHQLASESLYVPLVVISTWMLCSAVCRKHYGLLIAGALLLGVCTLIRPITLLWPIAALCLVGGLRSWRMGAVLAATAYAPIFLWMLVVKSHTGALGLGESGHTMGRNLYLRVAAIVATMPPQEAARVKQRYLTEDGKGNLSPIRYLTFGAQYPAPFLRHMARDTAVFFGKSGVERITVDYFASERQFRSLTDSDEGWRTRLDREGFLSTLRYLWETLGVVFVISLLGSVLFVMLAALALMGALRFLKQLRSRVLDPCAKVTAAVLIAFPLYIFMFSLVVNAVQSRQRAPAEFALAILAACALQRWTSARPAALADQAVG